MPNLKVGGGGFLAHMYAYNVFFEKFWSFYCLFSRRAIIFNTYLVCRQYFLPPTQYVGNYFYHILSMHERMTKLRGNNFYHFVDEIYPSGWDLADSGWDVAKRIKSSLVDEI
jgi:hypothetical protein